MTGTGAFPLTCELGREAHNIAASTSVPEGPDVRTAETESREARDRLASAFAEGRDPAGAGAVLSKYTYITYQLIKLTSNLRKRNNLCGTL